MPRFKLTWNAWIPAALLAAVQFAAAPVLAQQAERLRALDFTAFSAEMAALPDDTVTALDQLLPSLTIIELQAFMGGGRLSSEALTLYLLRRLKKYDDNLRTMLELNPDALSEAREADRLRSEGTVLGPLHGIPVTLKDNIETAGPMHTTAGAELLIENIAEDDAEVVQKLRAAGAVILGKANLSEFAGAITIGPKLGGTTAIAGAGANPFGDYPTGGSSSGSGGGVSALLTIVSVGSETSGSLIAPSAWQGAVGMKPSRGVVSGDGIFPLLLNNDSAGPIARNVTDLALLLGVIGTTGTDYAAGLVPDALTGVAVGVLAGDLSASGGNNDLLDRIAASLTLAGAGVKPAWLRDKTETLSEFTTFLSGGMRYDMMPYVARLRPEIGTPEALIAYNAADPERRIPFGQASFESISGMSADMSQEEFDALAEAMTAAAAAALEATFAETGASVLVSIDNTHAEFYATAGYPAITVPLGKRSGGGIVAQLGQNPAGMPVGVTLIGKPGEDAALIGYAFAFEQVSHYRTMPNPAD